MSELSIEYSNGLKICTFGINERIKWTCCEGKGVLSVVATPFGLRYDYY